MSSIHHSLMQVKNACDAIAEAVGRVVAWLTLLMVVTMFLIVVLRYAFNFGWIAMSESVVFMHALIFMLGSAYTLRHEGHVRVDIFYKDFDGRRRALIDLLGGLLLLMPMMTYILLSSWNYVWVAWSRLEGSAEPGGMPGVFLLKTSILLFALLMMLQGVSQIIEAGLRLKGYIPLETQREEGGI